MITRKFKIIGLDDAFFVSEKCRNYSYAFRLLFKMFDESEDPEIINRFQERFQLKDIEFRSLVSQVKAKKDSIVKQKENIEDEIIELEESLADDEELTKRKKYKIHKKISRLKRSLKNNPVFGGRKNFILITKEYNKGENRNQERVENLLNDYRNGRILPFFITGEGNQNGNRFFDLSNISNGLVIYKPWKGKKVNITFKLPKRFQKEFLVLQKLAMDKSIPVSVMLGVEWIYFTFDEEKLNGYSIDEVSRRYDVKLLKERNLPKDVEKEEIKNIYKEYYRKQEEKKLEGKIKDRCIAVDLNPTSIGFSILDKIEDGEAKVITCGLFDISRLCTRLGVSSSSKKQKWQNNKRRYELTMIVKRLFTLAKHYKCSQFIMEDLNLGKAEATNSNSKEFRRQVNFLWNRTLIEMIIQRRCNETGIDLVKVNPIYTSFIGNMRHPYVDATNASIEIGRRGLHKYTKGAFYPLLDVGSLSTKEVEKFSIDASDETYSSWVDLRKSLQSQFKKRIDFEHRLRTALDEIDNKCYSRFRIFSHKSTINCIIFNKLG